MEITRTINSDRRYYFDEQNIVNPDSLVNTICRFNDIKFQLYNRLYDKSFLKKGPLMDMTYSQWLKDHFQTNDYYNCLLYNEASAMVSSQRELKKLYVKTKKEIVSENVLLKRWDQGPERLVFCFSDVLY